MHPILTNANGRFFFRGPFSSRHLAVGAGFQWHNKDKRWYTDNLTVAAKLREYADESTERILSSKLIQISPWTLPLPSPPKDLTLLSYQTDSIRFALERSRCYLGLPPGMGKTIIAAMVADARDCHLVYICPPFLIEDVKEKFDRWNTCRYRPLMIPDSQLTDQFTNELLAHPKDRDNLLIVDEAHRFKNPEAKRTQALFGVKGEPGIVDQFHKHIFMSGTPMPNRPMELFPVLSKMAPETIDDMNQWDFGREYCGGFLKQAGRKRVWDFSGASNLPELRHKVVHPSGPFMLRLKKDLLDLPPKVEEVFVLSSHMTAKLAKMDHNLGDAYDSTEDAIKHQLALKAGTAGDDLHTATYRRLLGMEKVGPLTEYIENILDESNEPLLLFAYHKDVIKAFAERLSYFRPLVVTGSTPTAERLGIVKEFQSDLKRRLLIANYMTMVGYTLTKASRGLFAEFSWVPADNSQAGDRMHRIGQRSSVYIQYAVYKNSLDKKVIEVLLKKGKAIQHI